ncbi:hypothetical protein BGZ82_003419 [Podila clonocystis]|nr:hypothetical protein BGZ82_003419 [Podila clonocystis]
MLYSWDGSGALNEIQDFSVINRHQFSFTPVPASEGNASWSVILADYGDYDMDKPAKVSAKGLPSDLSTGASVGIAVGAVALVVIAGFAVRNWRHRLKNKKRDVELSKISSRT